MSGRDVTAELLALEHGMWSPATRFDDDWMADHLHDHFVEFGRSGRRYDRQTILQGAPRPFSASLDRLTVELLADDVALVTYRSTLHVDGAADEHANRSSVWMRVGERWRLRFHQGTPVEPDSGD